MSICRCFVLLVLMRQDMFVACASLVRERRHCNGLGRNDVRVHQVREEHVFSSSMELMKEPNKVCLLLALAICVLKKKKKKKKRPCFSSSAYLRVNLKLLVVPAV